MKRIHTAPDPIVLRALEAFLKSKGLEVLVRGEDRLSAAGGIPMTECWPELMLVDEKQEEQAKSAIAEFFATTGAEQSSWTCSKCGEQIDGQFTDCWKCQAAVSPSEPAPDPVTLEHLLVFRVALALNAILNLMLPGLIERGYQRIPAPVVDLVRASYPDSFIFSNEFSMLMLVLTILSCAGMFIFFNAARYLFVLLWLEALLSWLYGPISLGSGYTAIVGSLSGLCSGAIIALAFTSPLKDHFTGLRKT